MHFKYFKNLHVFAQYFQQLLVKICSVNKKILYKTQWAIKYDSSIIYRSGFGIPIRTNFEMYAQCSSPEGFKSK